MKKLTEETTTGSISGGSHTKPVKQTVIKKSQSNSSKCPCKSLPGKVSCGFCRNK